MRQSHCAFLCETELGTAFLCDRGINCVKRQKWVGVAARWTRVKKGLPRPLRPIALLQQSVAQLSFTQLAGRATSLRRKCEKPPQLCRGCHAWRACKRALMAELFRKWNGNSGVSESLRVSKEKRAVELFDLFRRQRSQFRRRRSLVGKRNCAGKCWGISKGIPGFLFAARFGHMSGRDWYGGGMAVCPRNRTIPASPVSSFPRPPVSLVCLGAGEGVFFMSYQNFFFSAYSD